MTGSRILPPGYDLGTRTLVVDSQGNGAYPTIQAALNAAGAVATSVNRWSVRVAPGVYAESLVLKDYVDLVGLSPGWSAKVKPTSGAAIQTVAACTVADLELSASDSAAVTADVAKTCRFERILVDQTYLDAPSFMVSAGNIQLYTCFLYAGGPFQLGAGTAFLWDSILRNQATEDGGSNMALYVSAAGTLSLYNTLVENLSVAGYGMYIGNASAVLKAFNSIFRKSTHTYAIDALTTTPFNLARCSGNAAHHNLSGYQDYVYNSSL